MSDTTYELTIRCRGYGSAAIDAEKAAKEILCGQYEIDERWAVDIDTEPEATTAVGDVILWHADLVAHLRRPWTAVGNVSDA